jgi:hypothetical protein
MVEAPHSARLVAFVGNVQPSNAVGVTFNRREELVEAIIEAARKQGITLLRARTGEQLT